MKQLVALVTVVAALWGWSDVQAEEARIAGFAFSCETLEGEKVKPKLGDIDGVSYSDLPAQRKQCLDEVGRKIAQCRENTAFGSDTRDWELAECLPLFREQAQMCVGHFERERVKCGDPGTESTGTVSLDSGERWRVQTALAADGFDPGPADGRLGPKTRRAIKAWQQAKGYPATGELTSAQVEALLGSADSPVPFGPNWIVTENQPCQLYNSNPVPGETVTWSGSCVDGKAFGEGRIVWRGSYGESMYEGPIRGGKSHGYGTYAYGNGERYEGEWRDDKRTGRGTYTWPDGGRYEGEWRNGDYHGHGVRTWANGNRYEGEWRDGKRTGRGTFTWADGDRYEGQFRDGEMHGRGTYAWADGDRYEGEWRNGDHHGHGVRTWSDGQRYEGQWRNDKPHGYGTFTRLDGERLSGQWRYGCFGNRYGTWQYVNATAAACGFE